MRLSKNLTRYWESMRQSSGVLRVSPGEAKKASPSRKHYTCTPLVLPSPPRPSLFLWPHLTLLLIGCAYAAYEEDRLGKIAPGYCADFVVVDKDVDLDPTQLPSSTILQVWVNGVKKL